MRGRGKLHAGVGRMAGGQLHPSPRECCRSRERLALEARPDTRQLRGRRPGGIEVPGRDLDLDLRLEKRRAP